MRILIVGAGATGGYFGGRLTQAGRDVTFLVRPGRAAHLRANGLELLSPHGDITVHPKIVTTAELSAPYDFVLLTVKSYALAQALEDMAPAVGPDTMIMPVLNGMKHVDAMIGRFGEAPVIGGVCKVATTIDDQGRIKQLATFQELAYGERDGSVSARTEALHTVMTGAGFEARLTATIMLEMWEKWVFLASLGGITCLMRGTVGDVVAASGGLAFANAFFDECVAVATASGFAPTAGFLAASRKNLTTPGSPLASSMYRDLVGGKPVEGDQIIGDLVARARQLGVATPLAAAAEAHLSVYSHRLAAAG